MARMACLLLLVLAIPNVPACHAPLADVAAKISDRSAERSHPDLEPRETKLESWTLLPIPNIKMESKEEATESETKRVKALIADLAKIDNHDDNLSPALTGNAFSPVETSRTSGMRVLPNHKLKQNSAFTSLVELGPKALPLLLESLEDTTSTKITIKKFGDFGGMWFGYPIRGNRVNKHETEMWAAVSDEPTAKAVLVDPNGEFSSIRTYTARVGDICYAAVGQITNRCYDVVNYQSTGCYYINSTVEDKSLAARVRAVWGTSDLRQKLLDSLLLDFQTRGDGSERLQIGAAMRLAYYYPEATEDIIVARLKEMEAAMTEPTKGGAGTSNEDLIQAVSWSSRPKIRAELLRLIQKRTDSKVRPKATLN